MSVAEYIRQPVVIRRYFQSILLVAAITLLGFPINNLIHPANLVMLYLAIVVFAAIFLGRGPSILASFLSVICFDFFFVKPTLSLSVDDTEYLITFTGFLTVGLIISTLTASVRSQVSAAQQREAQTSALYALSRDLTVALGIEQVAEEVVRHIHRTLNSEVALFVTEGATLKLQSATAGFSANETELAIAQKAIQSGPPSGKSSEIHTDSKFDYLPLNTTRGVVGILAVRFVDPDYSQIQARRQQMEGFANLAVLAIERARLSEQANQAQVLGATEKLQTALLNSISHDLRTPLVSIKGVLDCMVEYEQGGENAMHLDQSSRIDMIENAREEAARLNRLVENLLDMTRLESGSLKITFDECDIQDVIGSALAHLSDRLKENQVQVEIASEISLIPLDFVLMEQVMVNILDNAVKYSSPGKPIHIRVQQERGTTTVSIADRGIGIPPGDLERVFNKFYRVLRKDGTKGVGLGLSICKGIVEAHDGKIWAENRDGGGAIINLALSTHPREHGFEKQVLL